MFKGIQDVMHKKPKEDDTSLDLSLILVKKSIELLQDDKLIEITQKYPALLSLSSENYDSLCKPLIKHFAEFVQDLPETRVGYFSLKGGILEHALNRAAIGLTLLRSYFLPGGEESAPLSQPQTLWAYAIFTAGILQGIGKIAVDLHVELYDRNKKHLKEWSPFDGSMLGQGTYYKYDFDTPYPDDFRQRSCLLLARQLMPEEGFRWIASDKDLFSIWLSLLDDDQRGGRNLGPILWRADALVIQQYFEDTNFLRDPTAILDKGKFAKFAEGITSAEAEGLGTKKDTDIGAAFMKWIKTQVESKKISLGSGPVISVPGGVLLSNDSFKLFVRENPHFKNWQAVQTAFTGLGIHRVGGNNEIFQRYIRLHDKTTVSGILVTNKSLLLPKSMAGQAAGSAYVKAPGAATFTSQYIATNGTLSSQIPVAGAPSLKTK